MGGTLAVTDLHDIELLSAESSLNLRQSGPRLWLVILEGRERCPTITMTHLIVVAYCSKNRSGYNPQLID